MLRSRFRLDTFVCAVALAAMWAGRTWAAPAQEEKLRIVSLSPSATEILFALGAGDCVVGATTYCNYPAAAQRIERVGGFGAPSVEKVLSLKPDLVLAAGFERRDTVKALEGSGIRVVDVQAKSFEELFAAILRTGRAANRARQAEELVAKLRAELAALARQRAAAPSRRAPRVFVEIWDSPLTTVGQGSFVDDVVTHAGGVNVARDLSQPHPRVNPEKVIQWDPEVILVAHMARPRQSTAGYAGRIGWAGISAVKQGRIIDDIPTDLLLRPGPRLIDGVKALAARLHDVSAQPQPAPER